MAPEPGPGGSSSTPRPRPAGSQVARRPTTSTTTTRRPTLRMGPLTTTPVPPPETPGALGRLGSTSTSRLELGLGSGALARSGTTGRLNGSGALSRSGSGGLARPGPLPAGTVSLLRARAGPHGLAFDLRGVRHVDEPGLPGREVGRVVDLRALFDAPAAGGQTLAAAGPGGERLSLVVDAGKVELLRVGLEAIHPVPSPLGGVPALACVRALVVLDDGAVVLLIDPARLAPAPAEGGSP